MAEPSAGRAFVKGGCGCILFFLAAGVIVAVTGGHVRVDAGGLILLFLVGGVIGLAILGLRASRRPSPGGTGVRPARGPWTCASCGAANVEGLQGCVACGEPRR